VISQTTRLSDSTLGKDIRIPVDVIPTLDCSSDDCVMPRNEIRVRGKIASNFAATLAGVQRQTSAVIADTRRKRRKVQPVAHKFYAEKRTDRGTLRRK
jgi:hypothetical protein